MCKVKLKGYFQLLSVLMVIAITTGCHGKHCCDQHINVFTNPVGNTINIPVIKDSKGNKIFGNSRKCKDDGKNSSLLLNSYDTFKKISKKEYKNNQINTNINPNDDISVDVEPKETNFGIKIHSDQEKIKTTCDNLPDD